MKMKRAALFCIVSVFISSVALAEVIEVSSASLRVKPGSFYPVVATLKKGTEVKVLEKKGPWRKVSAPKDLLGWLSANALKPAEKTIDYGLLSVDTTGRRMATVMVTAAVKGFFENPVGKGAMNLSVFESPYVRYVEPKAYEAFKKETFLGRKGHPHFMARAGLGPVRGFQVSERMVATSAFVAGRLAEPGLCGNDRLVAYVNHVAQLVVESSEYYDMPISVHVVETEKIFANATPIGVILVSTGMLKQMRSEAELACLLGHELAHVTLGHGMVEAEARAPKISAEDAFFEMDDEMGTDAFEEEMEGLAMASYEHAIRGRKEVYEMEADRRGALYARRAGYDAAGMVFLLGRLEAMADGAKKEDGPSHWLPVSLARRIEQLSSGGRKGRGVFFKARYEKMVGLRP